MKDKCNRFFNYGVSLEKMYYKEYIIFCYGRKFIN